MLVEDRIHSTLVCRTCILQAKGYHDVEVHSQWYSEGCMLLVSWIYFDLIISGEVVHEGLPLKTARIVNHDSRDWEGELIFGATHSDRGSLYKSGSFHSSWGRKQCWQPN